MEEPEPMEGGAFFINGLREEYEADNLRRWSATETYNNIFEEALENAASERKEDKNRKTAWDSYTILLSGWNLDEVDKSETKKWALVDQHIKELQNKFEGTVRRYLAPSREVAGDEEDHGEEEEETITMKFLTAVKGNHLELPNDQEGIRTSLEVTNGFITFLDKFWSEAVLILRSRYQNIQMSKDGELRLTKPAEVPDRRISEQMIAFSTLMMGMAAADIYATLRKKLLQIREGAISGQRKLKKIGLEITNFQLDQEIALEVAIEGNVSLQSKQILIKDHQRLKALAMEWREKNTENNIFYLQKGRQRGALDQQSTNDRNSVMRQLVFRSLATSPRYRQDWNLKIGLVESAGSILQICT